MKRRALSQRPKRALEPLRLQQASSGQGHPFALQRTKHWTAQKKGMSTKCPKMSKNVRKLSKDCPEALQTQFSDVFWTFFAHLVVLLFGDPVQCSPVTTFAPLPKKCPKIVLFRLFLATGKYRCTEVRVYPAE